MKKLLVTLDFPPEKGGIQTYLHEIVMHTFNSSDRVIIGGEASSRSGYDSIYPCRVIRLAVPFSWINKKVLLLPILVMMIRIYIEEKGALAIFCGNIYTAFPPFLLSVIVPVNYMIYSHGSEIVAIRNARTPYGCLWKIVFRRATTIFYTTYASKLLLLKTIGKGSYKKCVPRIDVLCHIHSPKPVSDEIRLLSVGRLRPHKGHMVLIDATSMIGEDFPWSLTIAGDGPELHKLNERILFYGMEKKVSVKTSINDDELNLLYTYSHIFILPSIETGDALEGFGIVLLEAMAHGTAIIATKSGGIPFVFTGEGKHSAILVPPNNPEAIGEAIKTVALDSHLRHSMVVNAKRLLEKRYAW